MAALHYAIRDNTLRAEAVGQGADVLLGTDVGRIANASTLMTVRSWSRGLGPELWDDQSGVYIVEHLCRQLSTITTAARSA